MYRDLSNAQIVELYSEANRVKVRLVRAILGNVEAKAINLKNGDLLCEGPLDYVTHCMTYRNKDGLQVYHVIQNEFEDGFFPSFING